jgi:hypothetical protein
MRCDCRVVDREIGEAPLTSHPREPLRNLTYDDCSVHCPALSLDDSAYIC